jgi:NADH-quinone oxidoreductase subunit H
MPVYHSIRAMPGGLEVVDADRSALSLDGQQYFATVVTGWRFQTTELSVGLLFVLSTLSLAVYGIVVGGWASNNKYSFLGALRATASMISYEIPLGLSVLLIVLMFGTLDLGAIVDQQARYWMLGGVVPIPAWNVFAQPLAFVLFLVCIHAEANRAPFDLAEAEQELVGGYHTEYSSMRFALFFLSEYAGMITTSCVCVALFFGGWHLPGLDWAVSKITGTALFAEHPSWTESLLLCFLRMGVFFAKAIIILFVFMWVRWSLPRFRFDQLMRLAWGGLIPISLGMLLGTAVLVVLTRGQTYIQLDGRTALMFLGLNVAFATILLGIMGLKGPAPSTNKRIPVPGSRFNPVQTTPLS